jgi:chorismate--pyruvate lyase
MDGSDDGKLWLPGHALNCYEGNAALRDWLLTPGLLTQRIRESAGDGYRMTLVAARDEGAGGHVREIEMGCDDAVWMFAQTRVPRATLEVHPWLATLGTTTLGEALQAHGRVSRSDFDFAKLYDDSAVVARALTRAPGTPPPLWVRRSTFRVDGLPLLLQEVFLPRIGAATG